MKIDKGGTPIWVSPRRRDGLEVIQGTSRIRLGQDEVPELIRVLQEMSGN